jgi:hypothetical protein
LRIDAAREGHMRILAAMAVVAVLAGLCAGAYLAAAIFSEPLEDEDGYPPPHQA